MVCEFHFNNKVIAVTDRIKMLDNAPISNLKKSVKILKLVGLCPFYSDMSNGSHFYIFIVYSGLLYALSLCLLFILYYRVVFQTFSSHLTVDFNYAVNFLEKCVSVWGFVLTPPLYWRWSRKLSTYLKKWTAFESLIPLPPHNGKNSNEHFSFKNIKKIGLLFVVMMIAHFLKSFQIRYLPVYGLMAAFYLTLCLWLQNCIIIDASIRRLNRFIKIPKLRHQDFNSLLHIWMEFCSIVETSNMLFSHLLLLLLCAQAVLLMLNSYSVLSYLVLSTSAEYSHCISLSIIILLFTSWNVYTVCDISHHVTKTVKSSIPKQILFWNVLHLDISLLTKMRKTLEIINLTAPSICVLTCLKIDRKLLVSLMSIIITYLVVLVQFRMSSFDYKPGSSILDSILKNRTTL